MHAYREMCVYTCKPLKIKTKQPWVDIVLNYAGEYGAIADIPLREKKDIWIWRRSCDDRGGGLAMTDPADVGCDEIAGFEEREGPGMQAARRS